MTVHFSGLEQTLQVVGNKLSLWAQISTGSIEKDVKFYQNLFRLHDRSIQNDLVQCAL